jgi:ATP-binding cassette subfamily B protein
MWRLVVWQRRAYFVNAIFWTLVFTTPLLPGLIAKAFFDGLEAGPAGFNTLSFVALALSLGLARGVLVLYGVIVNVPFRFRIGGLLRQNVYDSLLERRGAQALSVPVGDAISTLRDDTDMAVDGVDWTLDVLGRSVFVVIALVILFSIDATVTLFVFVPLAVVLSLTYLLGARLERLRAASRESTARVTGLIAEMFSSVSSIQVAGAEHRVIEHFKRLGRARQGAMLRDVVTAQALESVFGNVVSLGTGFILLLVASKMREGNFSVGDFAVFASYLSQVAGITQFFGHFLNTYRQTGVSFKRMRALMPDAADPDARLTAPKALALVPSSQPESPTRAHTTDTLHSLEVRGLSVVHDSGRGVRDASFTLKPGSFTVITGRIGSGKTTLLRGVLGLLPRAGGEVVWNGIKADTLEPPRAAYTAQSPTLVSDTVLENIALGDAVDTARLERAIHASVLDADVPTLEAGLETKIGTKGVKLSGGQVSRVAAARMLYRDAELLVFDDLSSALDINTEHQLWERVFASGKTALVVSHRKPALQRADQIVLLEDGQVTAVGSLEHLLMHHAEMRRLWNGEI